MQTSPFDAPSSEPAKPDIELYCPNCSYNLHGLPGDRCPECGGAIDRAAIALSQLPWSHRRRIGRFRAYWRTVWMAMFHSNRLAREAGRPVNYREAQLFRLITVLIAGLPLCGLVILVHVLIDWDALDMIPEPNWMSPGSLALSASVDFFIPLVAGISFLPVVPICILLFLYAATGMGSYFFHPRTLSAVRQNRAIALSYYACAALAWLPFPTLFAAMAMGREAKEWIVDILGYRAFAALLLLTAGLLIFLLFNWWLVTLRLLKPMDDSGATKMSWAWIGLPIFWLLLAGLTLIALPWAVGLIALLLASFA